MTPLMRLTHIYILMYENKSSKVFQLLSGTTKIQKWYGWYVYVCMYVGR